MNRTSTQNVAKLYFLFCLFCTICPILVLGCEGKSHVAQDPVACGSSTLVQDLDKFWNNIDGDLLKEQDEALLPVHDIKRLEKTLGQSLGKKVLIPNVSCRTGVWMDLPYNYMEHYVAVEDSLLLHVVSRQSADLGRRRDVVWMALEDHSAREIIEVKREWGQLPLQQDVVPLTMRFYEKVSEIGREKYYERNF